MEEKRMFASDSLSAAAEKSLEVWEDNLTRFLEFFLKDDQRGLLFYKKCGGQLQINFVDAKTGDEFGVNLSSLTCPDTGEGVEIPIIVEHNGIGSDGFARLCVELQKNGISFIFSLQCAGVNLDEQSRICSEFERRCDRLLAVPKKVCGIEEMAQRGYKVPEYRIYMPADAFYNGKGVEREKSDLMLQQILVAAKAKGLDEIVLLIRSAHPMESMFPSGTFDSLEITVSTDISVEELQQCIARERRKIIEFACPVQNLTVARSIAENQLLRDFCPEDMGVLVNEKLKGTLFMIYPIGENGYSVRTLDGKKNVLELDIIHGVRKEEEIAAYFEKIKGLEGLEELDLSVFESMIRDIEAEIEFGGSCEFEIILSVREVNFVQVKDGTAEHSEEEVPVVITDEMFNSGVSSYSKMIRGYVREEQYFVSDSVAADQLVDGKLIVIDEAVWGVELDLPDYISDFTPDDWGKLTAKWREVLAMAGKAENIVLDMKNMVFSYLMFETSDKNYEYISFCFNKLCNNARIIIGGNNAQSVGGKNVHTLLDKRFCGSIYVRHGGDEYRGDPHQRSFRTEKFESWKTGDNIRVMLRYEECIPRAFASLIVNAGDE